MYKGKTSCIIVKDLAPVQSHTSKYLVYILGGCFKHTKENVLCILVKCWYKDSTHTRECCIPIRDMCNTYLISNCDDEW